MELYDAQQHSVKAQWNGPIYMDEISHFTLWHTGDSDVSLIKAVIHEYSRF